VDLPQGIKIAFRKTCSTITFFIKQAFKYRYSHANIIFHKNTALKIVFQEPLKVFMDEVTHNDFSGPVTVFHERRLPERATPVGYAALIDAYHVLAPTPLWLSAVGKKHKLLEQDGWRLYTPRHAPPASLEGHLTFALKYEGLDLAVLHRLFMVVGPQPITELVRAQPTGAYARRLWFLYEWLQGERLDLPDSEGAPYVPVVDPKLQFEGAGELLPRYRVRNNLPGTREFCPLVFKSDRLNAFVELSLQQRAQDVVATVSKDVLSRAAAFLLLKDSKSSFAIEGERPPQERVQRWGRIIGEAGRSGLAVDELVRLQRIVIGDARFVHLGVRTEGGFVGEHDRDTMSPLPDHISAKPDDLTSLLHGLAAFDQDHTLDAVIAAASLAFGFVYIHPFEDGNGRLHRYLIHHVLAERGFNPPGVVFPVSAAILEHIDKYQVILESYSARLLPLIKWEATPKGNIRVLNDTADYYRYYDATLHAEFLFECVQQTIEQDLPREAEFLRRHDRFRTEVSNLVDMPDRLLDLLFNFLQQNQGALSKRALEKEFSALRQDEIQSIEEIYGRLFPRNEADIFDTTKL